MAEKELYNDDHITSEEQELSQVNSKCRTNPSESSELSQEENCKRSG